MKKILIIFICMLLPFIAVAQTYDTLWQRAAQASRNDLPKSALEIVKQIYAKAWKESNDAQLLKAMLMTRVYGGEVSPDSASAVINRMEDALQKETQPAIQALWHSALAQVYASSSDAWRSKENDYSGALGKARSHYTASLSQLEALADARAKDFLPLFIEGNDSKYFNNDLLHVLFNAYRESPSFTREDNANMLSHIISLYEHRGNQDAVLLLTLDSLNIKRQNRVVNGELETNDIYRSYVSLATRYANDPLAVRVYEAMIDMQSMYDEDASYAEHNDSMLLCQARCGIALLSKSKESGEANELRNFISRLEQPRAQLGQIGNTYMPNQQITLQLKTRNLQQVQLRITKILNNRLDYDRLTYQQVKSKASALRAQSQTLTYTLPAAHAWVWQKVQKAFTLPAKAGVYYAELIFDGKTYDHKVFSVSSIHPLTFTAQGQPTRIVVVNSQNGHPVPHAQIIACSQNSKRQVKAYTADAEGTVLIGEENSRNSYSYYASTLNDYASLAFGIYSYGYAHTSGSVNERSTTVINLFTDRAIYRPGQKVHFSGVVFTRQGDTFQVVPNYEAKITLYNVNRKIVDTLCVRTDNFGSFDGTFTLPTATLPGRFMLDADGQSKRSSIYFKVEEYKRPTFTAETSPIEVAYALGDTVHVEGLAKTYSGVPVAGAKVKYAVQRSSWYRSGMNEELQTGECLTNAEGKFTIPVYLYANEAERLPNVSNWFHYTASYTVTADNGETAQGSATLSAAAWSARLELNIPSTLCKEHLPLITVRQINAAGKNIFSDGIYIIRSKGKELLRAPFQTGESFDLEKLKSFPSGQYELLAKTKACPSPSSSEEWGAKASFTLFSEQDTKSADCSSTLFTYERQSEAKDSAYVMVGTKETNAVLFYDLLAGNKVIESRRIGLSDSIIHLNLFYKPEYGDGAKAYFALVRNDTLHTFTATVQKPEPDKRLMLHWSSFRSRLVPGQTEEWHLQVTRPDGTPVHALVMAGMYDASLDVFEKNVWNFSGIYFNRYLPRADWHWAANGSIWNDELFGAKDYKSLPLPIRRFTQWNAALFDYYSSVMLYDNARGAASSRPMKMRAMNRNVATANSFALQESVVMVQDEAAPASDVGQSYGTADAAAPELASEKKAVGTTSGSNGVAVTSRSNFAETAFFSPSLRTNAQGECVIAFILPESMTTWNFSALAHDEAMNNGRLDTTLIARKEFMVEPALPRFIRQGDKTLLPIKVTNLSTSRIVATLTLTLEDALKEDVCIFKNQQAITLAAGESKVFNIPYEANTDCHMLICRTTATGSGYADGEEHYLPVLSDLVEVTRTLPFSITEKGTYTFQVDTLFNTPSATNRTLSVEMSSHPLWYVVTALPMLAGNSNCLSATEWSTRYYALTLGQYIAKKNPEVRILAEGAPEEISVLSKLKIEGLTDDTPWLRNAAIEEERGQALKNLFDADLNAVYKFTALDKLKDLQRSDGSWSWYPCMPGNYYITVDVAISLARVNALTGDTDADSMLQQAFDYLKKEVSHQVSEMKETEKRYHTTLKPSEVQMRYLYLRTLLNEQPDADAKFLLDRAEKIRKELTMYGKAICAIVLAKAGRKDAAQLNLQSLLEHTVFTSTMGRYFDTPRAEWSWQSYRIPTQCAAIEATDYFSMKNESASLRLWLLQSKRTQMWETSRATADAVFALLSTHADSTLLGQLGDKVPLYYTLKKGQSIVGFNAPNETEASSSVGYVRQTYTATPAIDATQFTVKKNTDGLACGSLYATFTIPTTEVPTEGKGLTITRRFEVQQGNNWLPLAASTVLQRGDRVRQVFTITADRDYDFVALTASRPACMEPTRALSGYQWNDGLSVYRAVRDAQTQYFIEQVSKGSHQFTEELFIDRAGIYSSGTAKIACVYSPEFCGTAAAQTFTAE